MGELKKRQHYVWRAYLRAWAHNEQIWTYLKQQDKTVPIGLMGVAQEKFFYELVDLTTEEIEFLKKYIDHTSHESVKELNYDFLYLFTSPYLIKRDLSAVELSPEQRAFIEGEIRKLEANAMEDAHALIEAQGQQLLSAIQTEDFSFLENQEDMFAMMMFICFQYTRTKIMRKNAEDSFKDHSFIVMSRIWHIISYTLATAFAKSFSFHPHLNFSVLKNKTSHSFLTCDQPVFNSLSDHQDSDGNPTAIELYYPLSPKLALLIAFDEKPGNWITTKELDDVEADQYNKKVVAYASEFCFGNSKAILDYYFQNSSS